MGSGGGANRSSCGSGGGGGVVDIMAVTVRCHHRLGPRLGCVHGACCGCSLQDWLQVLRLVVHRGGRHRASLSGSDSSSTGRQ